MFYQKCIQVHVFCLGFSWVHLLYDDNTLILIPESMRPGRFLSWTIVDNLNDKPKIEHLLIEQKVWCVTCHI